MVVKKHGVIIETPTEARQAEPGPSVLLLLVVSLSIAVIVLGLVWFVFFVPTVALEPNSLPKACGYYGNRRRG